MIRAKIYGCQSSLWSGSTHTLDNRHFPTQVINVKRVGIELMETFLRYKHKNHQIETYLSEEVLLIGKRMLHYPRERNLPHKHQPTRKKCLGYPL
mgnify:CR=1 FL=1